MNKLTISESITLLLPEDFDFDCSFTNSISVVRYGFRLGKGNWGAWLWEQLFFALYVKKNRALGVVFSNRVPFFMPDCAVVLHDIAPIVHKEFYDTNKKKLFRAVFEANIWFMERFARAIITVSEFSRTEILKYTKISKEKISVIYPSWQHTERIKPALNVIAKYPFLVGNPYYFSISSMTLNKNFKWIIVAAIHNPGDIFVVGGGGDFLPIVQSICPQIPSNL
jgi:glycosyltransferase involved in cell wall biosynthesis